MNTTDAHNRRTHADRCAHSVSRDLSGVIGELCEMGRVLDYEFNAIALEIEKLQRRINDVAERVH